ncbi:hypothetical protein ACFXC8_00250 [Streptomyces sp. NPDC059441]|uniref:hypothetical protein n=1 Tax=unclassified Streptomyces TaxID=2593676 RepID=UPI0029BC6531|nr:hypothetical protein [Streptomyces sp. AK02-04a]MDX3759302.1 hypothetical protein [Streptomyces sp. AK02-04a]
MTENPEQHRRPGEWPIQPVDHDEPAKDHDELYVERAQEHALREMVLGSIRHHLSQQPSTGAIRAAERRWKSDITNLADELINTRRTER